jgi:hypothetical protein
LKTGPAWRIYKNGTVLYLSELDRLGSPEMVSIRQKYVK